MEIELNASKMEKMGTSRLEAIVSLYCLNGLDDVEFFVMALREMTAKICYLTQQELKVDVLLITLRLLHQTLVLSGGSR